MGRLQDLPSPWTIFRRSQHRSIPFPNSTQRSLKAALPSSISSMHSSCSEHCPPPTKQYNLPSSARTPTSPPSHSMTSALASLLRNSANRHLAASTPFIALAETSPPTTKASPKARTNASGAAKRATGLTTAWRRKPGC